MRGPPFRERYGTASFLTSTDASPARALRCASGGTAAPALRPTPGHARRRSRSTFDTRKAVALLAYLAVTDRPHRRETLAALLWPESDQARARAALRRTLSVAGVVGPALVLDRGEVALDRAGICERRRGVRATWPPAPRRWTCAAAVDLAPDPFLHGFSLRDSPEFDEWLVATSDLLGDRLAGVLARLTEADAAGRSPRRGPGDGPPLGGARPAQRVGPSRASCGCWPGPASARRRFGSSGRASGVLDRELGVAPLPETTDLYDAIRANRLEPANAPPPRDAGTDSGIASGASPGPGPARPIPGSPSSAAGPARPVDDGLAGRGTRWSHRRLVGAPGLGRTALIDALASRRARRRRERRRHPRSLRGSRPGVRRCHRPRASAHGRRRLGRCAARPGRRAGRDAGRAGPALRGGRAGRVDRPGRSVPGTPGRRRRALPRPDVGRPGRLRHAAATARACSSSPPGAATPGPRSPPRTCPRRWCCARSVLPTWRPGRPARAGRARRRAGPPADRRGAAAGRRVQPRQRPTGATSPTGLRDLVSSRLDDAPPATRQLVGTAAVLGSVADPELLRQTSGRDEAEVVEAVEDAVARGLLVEDVAGAATTCRTTGCRTWCSNA